MRFHVLIKVLFHIKIFTAPLAHKLFVSNMDAHVGTKLVLVLEPFITILQYIMSNQFPSCRQESYDTVAVYQTEQS